MLNSILTDPENGYLYVRADGSLTREEFDGFVPALEKLVRSRDEPLPVLIELGTAFDADSVKTLWQEARPDTVHMKRIGRVALVGDSDQQPLAARASNSLRDNVELRFFEHAKRANAEQWLRDEPMTELP